MQPIPYIFFNSGCRAAMEHYGAIFGTTPDIMSVSDMPPDVRAAMPGAPDDAVMHASLQIGEGMLFASDDPSGEAEPMAGCNVSLALPDEAETRRVWDALAEGAEIRMPLEPTFWTPLFGTLTDRFGVRWMIQTDNPDFG